MATRRVLYSSPFVPAEWIAAHGFVPSRYQPETGEARPGLPSAMGVCPYAQSFLGAASRTDAAAVVFTTACDQMRRAADYLDLLAGKDAFVLQVPATWQTATAKEMYREDLLRLSHYLVRRGGQPPSRLALLLAMRHQANGRASLLEYRTAGVSARQFAEITARFLSENSLPPRPPAPASHTSRADATNAARLALVGGPLLPTHFALFDLIESFGGRVVLDATETGERGLLPVIPLTPQPPDPFAALVDAYFDGIPDVFQRPNRRLYDWLARRLKERQTQGIVVWRYSWCDLWHAEVERMRSQLGLPVLDLDAGDSHELTRALRQRVQAFLELLTA